LEVYKISRSLILWRHAHAGIGSDDYNRKLDERGKNEAKIMAKFLLKNKNPDLILCSTASRAIETLNALLEVDQLVSPVFDKNLYLAEPRIIINSIIKAADNQNTILLIAHNPGIHELSKSLTKNNKKKSLQDGFPTASMAFISMESEDWCNLGNNQLRLEKLIRPKDLNN
jgi:phosphohistidine phosphatase